MVEADDILGVEVRGRTDFEPSIAVGPGIRMVNVFLKPRFRGRQHAFHVVGGILHLPEDAFSPILFSVSVLPNSILASQFLKRQRLPCRIFGCC